MLSSSAQQTIFDDPELMQLIRQGAEKVYSIEVDSAKYYIRQVESRVPDHPIVPAMQAFLIQWQYIPMLQGDVYLEFQGQLNTTIRRAEALGEDSPEAIFFTMAARGLLAEYYADDGQYMKAFKEANKMYGMLKEGFEYVDEYPEFLFTTGLYNYFREKYPEKHPIYSPLLWFFKSGDIELGLEQIHQATQKTILSQVESYIYLAYIYLRYEEKPDMALDLLIELKDKYPTNPYVVAKYLEAAHASHNYELITKDLVDQLKSTGKLYYQMTGHIFEGTRLEMVEGDSDKAFDSYRIGTDVGDEIVGHGEYYKSIGYLGMGRIKKNEGAIDESQEFYRKALEYAETTEIAEEAKLGTK